MSRPMKQWIVTLCLTTAWLGCASQTDLPRHVRKTITDRHANRLVELRMSHYYGDLYDENQKWLLSPYPFAETHHIVDTKGAPIHPKGQKGIAPAGTVFRIEKVEFPDLPAMAKRMLTTPRYNTWVYLVPTHETSADVPRNRKAFILLLPMELDSEAAVEEELERQLAPAGTVQAWLQERRPSVRTAIVHKDIVPGMSQEELTAAMGPPQTWFNDRDPKGRHVQVAWYPTKEAWLVDGAVQEIKDARAAEPMAPGVIRQPASHSPPNK